MSRLTFLHGLGDVALRYGVEESIFLHMVISLAMNNKDNDRNYRDGRWWTYNSLAAWEAAFPWWSAKQIRRIITSCREKGALLVGEYNKDPRDRTAWYSPSDELLAFYRDDWTGTCMCPNGQMHEPERARSRAQMGTPLPKDTQSILTKDIYAHLSAVREILSGVVVADDDRAASMAVTAALEENGYLCQNNTPVPSRDNNPKYTGRIGIVASREGFITAIEIDRKSARRKSIHKLLEYPCDARLILLRGGTVDIVPDGIDAVISLTVKEDDDYFHRFWDAYPKKVDKRRAYEVFKRLNVTHELLGEMLRSLEVQKKSPQWQEANGQFIPHATTWLNGRRWEDVVVTPAADNARGNRYVE